MLHRYLLCIEAVPEVAAMVEGLGGQLEAFLKRPRHTTAPVHITLLLVDMPMEFAPELQAAIERGLQAVPPFTLHLDGIRHFADKRTIYADPVEKDILVGLADAVGYVNANAAPGAKISRNCVEPAHLGWFRQDLWTPMTTQPAQADWIVAYAPSTRPCPIPPGFTLVHTVGVQGAVLAQVYKR